MMAEHGFYGCPCCSGTFGGLFAVNDTVRDLKDQAASGKGWSQNWGIDWESLGRQDFLETGAAAASLAALIPKEGRAQTALAETTTLFRTVEDNFSEAARGSNIAPSCTMNRFRA